MGGAVMAYNQWDAPVMGAGNYPFDSPIQMEIAPRRTGQQPLEDSGGTMTPAQLRQKAAQEGWSEDFARFPDAQLQIWIDKNWDPAVGKFRSEHTPPGAEGQPWTYVEKPSESIIDPNGDEWGPWGDKVGVKLPRGGGAGGGAVAAAAPKPEEVLGSRGWGTEQDPTLEGMLAQKNFQQLRGAYGLGSEAALNQTSDLATMKDGAVMWGGASGADGTPAMPNLGGMYGDLKKAATPQDPWFAESAVQSGAQSFGAAPTGAEGQGPWGGYTQQAPNENFSTQLSPWAQAMQKKKKPQGAYGEVVGGY